jgi:serine/threonine protein phosphatase PrpC/formylglycine-generating enzyme required for sulfatase activity
MSGTLLEIESAIKTDPGRVRAQNQDYVGYFVPQGVAQMSHSGRLYVLADGIGGAASGEIASRYAVQRVLHDYYDPRDGRDPAARLKGAIRAANAEIYQHARNAGPSQMGTTLVAAVARGDQLIVANVGDSRAYLVCGKSIRQITEDHSLTQELVRQGAIGVEDIPGHDRRNVVVRSLGIEPTVEIDLFQERLQPGDVVLLCSDGLTRYYPDADELRDVLTSQPLAQAAEALIRTANERGGKDNISVVVLRASQPVATDVPEAVQMPEVTAQMSAAESPELATQIFDVTLEAPPLGGLSPEDTAEIPLPPGQDRPGPPGGEPALDAQTPPPPIVRPEETTDQPPRRRRLLPGLIVAVLVVLLVVVIGGLALAHQQGYLVINPTLTPTPLVAQVIVATSTESPTATPPDTPTPPAPTETPVLAEGPHGSLLILAGPFVYGVSQGDIDAALELCFEYAAEPEIDCVADTFADAMPQVTITISAFYMGRTEVSNREYIECLDGGACTEPNYLPKIEGGVRADSVRDLAPDLPVAGLTRDQAAAYCAFRGGRLPTEAEWEKAASWGPDLEGANAADKFAYPWGEEWKDGLARTSEPGSLSPVAVDSLPQGASRYGLMNMAGNVAEWVADWYAPDYYQMLSAGIEDPRGPSEPGPERLRVTRGGGFEDTPPFVQTTYRRLRFDQEAQASLGVRCAWD